MRNEQRVGKIKEKLSGFSIPHFGNPITCNPSIGGLFSSSIEQSSSSCKSLQKLCLLLIDDVFNLFNTNNASKDYTNVWDMIS